jgi:lipoprotein-releasing system ATP-binding protein
MIPALLLEHVVHGWPQTGRVLDGASLSLFPGETAALLAPSGAGKTTLLHIAALVLTPHAGRVAVAGETAEDDRARTRLRRRRMGIVFQDHRLLPEIDATDNAAMPLLLDGVAAPRARAAAEALLTRLGIGHRLRHPVGKLSGGEAQRVAVARALIHRPALVLADEPTGSLDHATGADVLGLLLNAACSQGAALLMATHDPEAARRCARRLRLAEGQVRPEA